MANVKVFSSVQPYATFILQGNKAIETRSRKTNYRGEIYIHAPLTRRKEWLGDEQLMSKVKDNMLFGYITCKAKLVDCVEMTEEFIQSISEAERKLGFYEVGRYAWILEDVQPITPIKAKGNRNIWNYEL